MERQVQMLQDAGARTETSNDKAARYVGRLLQAIERSAGSAGKPALKEVDLGAIKKPLAGINVGLESFSDSLTEQGAKVVHVDWKPAAAGNEKLAGILGRMRQK
jgi:FdrA protein